MKIWDATSGQERTTLGGHTEWIEPCAISPDGSFIVSASWDKTLKIWDAASGKERATLAGHIGEVRACGISPDGSIILSTSQDGTLKIWETASGRERATVIGHTDLEAYLDLAVREDATPMGHTDGVSFVFVYPCAISPDGSFIVSASWDNTLKIWDARSGIERATLTGNARAISVCAISPDGSFIVSASHDKTLKIWDAASGIEMGTLIFPGKVFCVSMHPLRPMVVCGHAGGDVSLFDLMGIRMGPPVVTAWSELEQRWLFKRRAANKKSGLGCPQCRVWSEIPASALGTEIPCPNCGQRLKLNSFTVNADWRPIAAAWRGGTRPA